MTKLDIADKLGSQKMSDGSTENFWLFGDKRPWPSSIEFKDGRVIYAAESWIGSDGDAARALFGAVSSLTKQGYANCEISSDTQTTPSLTAERVWIVCGKKSILVQRMWIPDNSKNTYRRRCLKSLARRQQMQNDRSRKEVIANTIRSVIWGAFASGVYKRPHTQPRQIPLPLGQARCLLSHDELRLTHNHRSHRVPS
jgi:hypothetical protein